MDKELIQAAQTARGLAYAPYSNFKVGVALLGESGKIYKGCNVENMSYGLTICAERVAAVKAISEGERDFKKMAIATDMDKPCPPCGMCRQFLYEFSPDMEIIMANLEGEVLKVALKELLPNAFKELPTK